MSAAGPRDANPGPCALRHITLENTALVSSRIGLGTHALHRVISSRQRQNLLSGAHELGVRYFDTAPSYGAGLAEAELGRFLVPRRSEVVLTTKFGLPVSRLAAAVPGWNQAAMVLRAARKLALGRRTASRPLLRDYSPQQALASVERSLRALRTDHIDILYLHEPVPAALSVSEPLVRALDSLKASGKVRYVGLSGQESECALLRNFYPALGEVLQVQVPAASDGWPITQGMLHSAAVHFWEFASRSPEGVTQVAERLCKAAPEGVLLVSSVSVAQLQQTSVAVEKFDARAAKSATSAHA